MSVHKVKRFMQIKFWINNSIKVKKIKQQKNKKEKSKIETNKIYNKNQNKIWKQIKTSQK